MKILVGECYIMYEEATVKISLCFDIFWTSNEILEDWKSGEKRTRNYVSRPRAERPSAQKLSARAFSHFSG